MDRNERHHSHHSHSSNDNHTDDDDDDDGGNSTNDIHFARDLSLPSTMTQETAGAGAGAAPSSSSSLALQWPSNPQRSMAASAGIGIEQTTPHIPSAAAGAAPASSKVATTTSTTAVDATSSATSTTHDSKMDDTKSKSKSSKGSKKEKKFPWVLHKIIEDAEKEGNQHIVAWMPSGRSFVVHKRDVFMEEILPRYFRQTKYKSFVRQLNLWGFTYIDQGPDRGSYYCEHFVKGKPWLCHEMKRMKVKGHTTGTGSGGGTIVAGSGPAMMVTSPTPSPYTGGRSITRGGLLPEFLTKSPDSADMPSRAMMSSSSPFQQYANVMRSMPSISAIHSSQQSILFGGDTPNPQSSSALASPMQTPQIQRQRQQQQQQQQQPQFQSFTDRFRSPHTTSQRDQVMFSPMPLDTPMIQAHHQSSFSNVASSMSTMMPGLDPSSSSAQSMMPLTTNMPSSSFPNSGGLYDRLQQVQSMSEQHQNQHPMMDVDRHSQQQHPMMAMSNYSVSGDDGYVAPIGFLPSMHTRNTSPMMAREGIFDGTVRGGGGGILGGGRSNEGAIVGGTSHSANSGDMSERIDTMMLRNTANATAFGDAVTWEEMLPSELEPRHFRVDNRSEKKSPDTTDKP